MNKENQNEKGVYINGKQQVIDMLKLLTPEEKNRILRGIKARNPQMARELSENSLSFTNLYHVASSELTKIFSGLEPAVTALAIKYTPESFQRKVLRSIDRSLAEQAYSLLQKINIDKKRTCEKAQNKVLETVVALNRKGLIAL